MIAIFTTRQEAKIHITNLVRAQTDETIVVAQNQEDIPDLIESHNPQTVLLFMPNKTSVAIEIKTYIGAVLPHCRIRILPFVASTDQLHPTWSEVVLRALTPRKKRTKIPKKAS
jgi:hypothetical protein